MTGVLPVCKPPGPTSHDVVTAVRRWSGERRVGHAGTLDPAAAGVLPVCLGAATRLQPYLHLPPKTYRFLLVLGEVTATADATGPPVRRVPASHLEARHLLAVLPRFHGRIRQRVPAFSAKRQSGVRLYEAARRGEVVEPPLAECAIHRLELLQWQGGPAPRALCEVECSSGTYVRALCADIGEALGVGGHMAALVRVCAAGIPAAECATLEEVAAWAREGLLATRLLPPAQAVGFLPALVVDGAEAEGVRHGRAPREGAARAHAQPRTTSGAPDRAPDAAMPAPSHRVPDAPRPVRGAGGSAAAPAARASDARARARARRPRDAGAPADGQPPWARAPDGAEYVRVIDARGELLAVARRWREAGVERYALERVFPAAG